MTTILLPPFIGRFVGDCRSQHFRCGYAAGPARGRETALDAVYLVGDRPVRVCCDDAVLGALIDPAHRGIAPEPVGVCLPSRHEAFSVAIIEALAAGCPVVIMQTCHFPEVADAGAGVVVPLDSEPLADELDTVLSNDDYRASAANARRLDHYTWPKIAEKSITAYQQILA